MPTIHYNPNTPKDFYRCERDGCRFSILVRYGEIDVGIFQVHQEMHDRAAAKRGK